PDLAADQLQPSGISPWQPWAVRAGMLSREDPISPCRYPYIPDVFEITTESASPVLPHRPPQRSAARSCPARASGEAPRAPSAAIIFSVASDSHHWPAG